MKKYICVCIIHNEKNICVYIKFMIQHVALEECKITRSTGKLLHVFDGLWTLILGLSLFLMAHILYIYSEKILKSEKGRHSM